MNFGVFAGCFWFVLVLFCSSAVFSFDTPAYYIDNLILNESRVPCEPEAEPPKEDTFSFLRFNVFCDPLEVPTLYNASCNSKLRHAPCFDVFCSRSDEDVCGLSVSFQPFIQGCVAHNKAVP